MIDGCGRKIPSSRTVVVKKGDDLILEEKTQQKVDEIMRNFLKK